MNRRQHQIRLANLETLITEAGSAAKLARRANTSGSYLSQVRNQLLSTTGTPRTVGNDLAERLEHSMGKSSGWMDEDHEDVASIDPIKEYASSACALLPLISWEQVPRWSKVEEGRIQYRIERLPCPTQCGESSFALAVQGSSMEPKFHNGEFIFADPDLEPRHGQYVVVHDKGAEEAMLRQLIIDAGRHYLQVLNPDWPLRIIEVTETITVCAVVIFRGEAV